MIALTREIGSWLTWMPRSSVNLLHGYGRHGGAHESFSIFPEKLSK
jgi:hypothetical protein